MAENLRQREIIIIALGKFGKQVADIFSGILDERSSHLSEEEASAVNIHTVSFANEKSFSYVEAVANINNAIKDSAGKFSNKPFSYFIVGDLDEKITSLYSIDYSFLPHLLDQTGTLSKQSVTGFFTFSDQFGAIAKSDDESVALTGNFFKKLYAIDLADSWDAPFKDANSKKFNTVSCPNGPFDRNYVVVSPGDFEFTLKQMALVFAERLFYELYYLGQKYEDMASESKAVRDMRSGTCFSTFSMVQIIRSNELQHYYLSYQLEKNIIEYMLKPAEDNKDSTYFENKFFEMIDIPSGTKEFPIDRAVELFIKQKKAKFQNLLSVYYSYQSKDIKEYVNECKIKIDNCANELTPDYSAFARDGLNALIQDLKDGLKQLFCLDRLTGGIESYIKYVTELRSIFSYWKESLEKRLKETEEISIDEYYDKTQKKIRRIQRSIIYKIPLFIPIRRKMIENSILGIPVEKYLEGAIKSNLSKAFLDELKSCEGTSKYPETFCGKILGDLEIIKDSLLKRKNILDVKINYIEEINRYDYVISEEKQKKDYTDCLKRIRERNFGAAKENDIKNTAVTIFKLWTKDKDLIGITQNPKDFINHIKNTCQNFQQSDFDQIESDISRFNSFCDTAVEDSKVLSSRIVQKSFAINSSDTDDYVNFKRVLLDPKHTSNDALDQKISDDVEQCFKVEIPKEFTLGSIVYFYDFLYMDIKLLKKYEEFKKYDNIHLAEPVYIGNEGITAHESVQINKNSKIIMHVLHSVCNDEQRSRLTSEKSEYSLTLEDCINSLTNDQLNDYARANGVMLTPNRDKLIQRLVRTLEEIK